MRKRCWLKRLGGNCQKDWERINGKQLALSHGESTGGRMLCVRYLYVRYIITHAQQKLWDTSCWRLQRK